HTRFSRDWSSDVCSSDLLLSSARGGTASRHPSGRGGSGGAPRRGRPSPRPRAGDTAAPSRHRHRIPDGRHPLGQATESRRPSRNPHHGDRRRRRAGQGSGGGERSEDRRPGRRRAGASGEPRPSEIERGVVTMRYRTHFSADLVDVSPGEQVTVAGWVARRRDHGGIAFLDIRDGHGLVQVVVDPGDLPQVDELRMEYTVSIRGTVAKRPEGTINPDLITGEIVIQASELTILSPADPLPFMLDDRTDID